MSNRSCSTSRNRGHSVCHLWSKQWLALGNRYRVQPVSFVWTDNSADARSHPIANSADAPPKPRNAWSPT